jgi:outer membrane receptor for ferrienterochelin and colicin
MVNNYRSREINMLNRNKHPMPLIRRVATPNTQHLTLYSYKLCLSVIFLSLTPYTFAQEFDDEDELLSLYGDEETISIATGTKQPLSQAPAVASVITSETIAAMGATDIDEILETVPGLHVSRDPFNYDPIYTFRGIVADFNPQVLMLINGIPITNLFHGNRSLVWGGMPVKNIDHIEVIRGPGSALYGSDAFAGVINIVTKTAKDISGTEVGGRGGSYDTWDAWLLHGDKYGEWEIAFSAQYHTTNGPDQTITADAQTLLDTGFGTNASLAPGSVNLSRENTDLRIDLSRQHWRVRAGLQRRRDLGSGAGVASALDPNNRYESDRWNLDISYDNPNFSENWSATAMLTYLDTSQVIAKDMIVFPAGSNLGFGVLPNGLIGNPEVYERHYRLNAATDFSGWNNHQLRFGLGAHYGDLYKVKESKNFGIDPSTGNPLPLDSPVIDVSDTPYAFLPEEDRENYHAFVQDIWQLANDWTLTTGVRFDHYTDFGDTINPRLSLVWSVDHDLTAKILYGQAFRAPSFAQRFNKNNPVAIGNPDLDPETMESTELALNYQPSPNVRFAGNIFYYEWEDIVQFHPDGIGNLVAENTGAQKGKGFELEAHWQLMPELELNANYAWQRSMDETIDKNAGMSPRQQLYLQMQWSFLEDWQLNSSLNWVMDRERVDGDTRKPVDDYRWANLTLHRDFPDQGVSIIFAARNLFDSDAREPSQGSSSGANLRDDLPLQERHYYAEVRYSF